MKAHPFTSILFFIKLGIYTNILMFLLACQTVNRKPQAASFGGYCPECLIKNIDLDLANLQNTIQKTKPQNRQEKVPVRYVTVLDKSGKPVCRVNLQQHPDLVPSFAKLEKPQMVEHKKFKRSLASVGTGFKLPNCNAKYLNQLKKIAKNNVVVNGNQATKVAWPLIAAGGVAACALGISASKAMSNVTRDMDFVTSFAAYAAIEGRSAQLALRLKQQFKVIKGLVKAGNLKTAAPIQKLSHAFKHPLTAMAGIVGSACFIGTEIVDIGMIAYDLYDNYDLYEELIKLQVEEMEKQINKEHNTEK